MAANVNEVDLVFVVDTTGSMGPFIQAARQQMVAMLSGLSEINGQEPVDMQVGIVEYRDHPPQELSFVYHAYPLQSDLKTVQKAINKLKPQGGGDGPEAVYDGLWAACEKINWRRHSQRIAVLIGDAPPHGILPAGDAFPGGCPCGLHTDGVTALLEEKRVILYSLSLTAAAEASFTRLAWLTGGQLFTARQGNHAISAIRDLLVGEFNDLAFDRQVRDLCLKNPGWSIDWVCEALNSPRGRVSTSLSRLGRRSLLVQEPEEIDPPKRRRLFDVFR